MIRHIKAAVSGCYRSLNRTLRFVSAACFSEDVVNEMRWKKKTLQRQLRVAVTESNQSSFPLINEWLQEAAHQVAKPIDWTTSGAFPSVCLITVIPPTFAIHLHIPANEQLTGSTFPSQKSEETHNKVDYQVSTSILHLLWNLAKICFLFTTSPFLGFTDSWGTILQPTTGLENSSDSDLAL